MCVAYWQQFSTRGRPSACPFEASLKSAHNYFFYLPFAIRAKQTLLQTTSMKKPFRYGIFAKLVIGTFLSFFLLFRIEGVSGSSSLSTTNNYLCCTTPQTRLVDTNQQFQIAMDIPGVEPDDLEVSIDNDARTIQLVGNRRDEDGDVIGCFEKSFEVNDTSVDLDSLVVQHDNGVLTVWAPKDNTRRNKAFISTRKKEKAFIRRGSTTKTKTYVGSKQQQQATVTKIKPIITAKTRMERIEDSVLSEEDPMIVDPIAYDEQELLESVSVLTEEEEEFWNHRM